jgi:hypothetical protein
MDFKDLAAKVLDYAPLVGGALGGPPGAAIGGAVKVLAGLFGVKSADPTPDEINTAMTADPEMALKLKQADYAFTLEMRRIDKEEFLASLADVASARGRQIEHERVTGKSDWNLYSLAWLFVGGFFVTLIVMTVLICTGKFPAVIPDAAIYLLGSLNGCLTAGVGAVTQYFFGKTKDSAAHVDALANSMPFEEVGKLLRRKVDLS